MAIIGEIRKHYWLLVVIIGFALLLFVLSDFQRRRQKTTNTLAVIAGEKVAISEFNKKVEDNIDVQKANTGKDNITAEEATQIRQNTWQQMVNEIVMQKQFDKLGVDVSMEELQDMITGNNPHEYIKRSFTDPKTGVFDKKGVVNFLQNLDKVDPEMKQRYLMMEKAIKEDRLNTKYNNLLTKGFYTPNEIAKRNYEEANAMAKARMLGVKYQVLSDSAVTVTDADFEKYYKENSYKFQQDKPVRQLEYVLFEPKMSDQDMAELNTQVKNLYNEFQTTTNVAAFVNSKSDNRYDSTWKKRGSFSANIDSLLFRAPVGMVLEPLVDNNSYRIFKVVDRQMLPDSLKASHILISYAGSGVKEATRSREEAIHISDSLFDLVKKNPGMFDAIASNINDDPTSKQKNGSLGWFANGSMVPEFNNAVLRGNAGEIKKVETMFGYHIIRVEGKKGSTQQIKVASVDLAMQPGSQTLEKIYNDASTFSSTNNTIEKFEKAGKSMNLRTADRVNMSDNTIPGLNNAREVVRWAFKDNTDKGDVSQVFDVEGTYVVAALKEKVAAGTVPLSVLKEGIRPLVIRDKKAEMISKRINNQFAKMKDVNALLQEYPNLKIDTVSVAFASANIPNFGHESAVTGELYSAKKGQLTGPVKGDMAVYVFILDDLVPAPATKDYDSQKKQNAVYFQGRINAYSNILQEKANIKDNRLLFF